MPNKLIAAMPLMAQSSESLSPNFMIHRNTFIATKTFTRRRQSRSDDPATARYAKRSIKKLSMAQSEVDGLRRQCPLRWSAKKVETAARHAVCRLAVVGHRECNPGFGRTLSPSIPNRKKDPLVARKRRSTAAACAKNGRIYYSDGKFLPPSIRRMAK
jgi:hypothetical protein